MMNRSFQENHVHLRHRAMEEVLRNVQVVKVDVRQSFAVFFRQLKFFYPIFQRITTTTTTMPNVLKYFNAIQFNYKRQ